MKQKKPESGYLVDVTIDHIEKMPRTPGTKNPRYRFHTDLGLFTTEPDIQQSYELTGDETGPATLTMEDSRVRSWTWPATNATAGE